MGWKDLWMSALVCSACGPDETAGGSDGDLYVPGPLEGRKLDPADFCAPGAPPAFALRTSGVGNSGSVGLCGHMAIALDDELRLIGVDGEVRVLSPGSSGGRFSATGRVLLQPPNPTTLNIYDVHTATGIAIEIPEGEAFEPYGTVPTLAREDFTYVWACANGELLVGSVAGLHAIADGVECREVFGAARAPVLLFAGKDGALHRADLDADSVTALPFDAVAAGDILSVSADGSVIAVERTMPAGPGPDQDTVRTRIELFDTVLDELVGVEPGNAHIGQPDLDVKHIGDHIVQYGHADGTRWVWTTARALEERDPDDEIQVAPPGWGPAFVSTENDDGQIVEAVDVGSGEVLETIGEFPPGPLEFDARAGVVAISQETPLCAGDCDVPVWAVWVHQDGELTGPRHVVADRSTQNVDEVALVNTDGVVLVAGEILPDGVTQDDLDAGASGTFGACWWNDGGLDSCVDLSATEHPMPQIRVVGAEFVHTYKASGVHGVEVVLPAETTTTHLASGGDVYLHGSDHGPVIAVVVRESIGSTEPAQVFWGRP